MIKEGLTLQTAVFGSGAIGDLLNKWAEAGFFSYLLPFLLIFSLVFGILTRVKIFKDNKVVNGIIALAVAMMSLQFSFVPAFFSQIFPRVGVGLAIILAVMIIVGLFADEKSPVTNYILVGIGLIIVGIVIVQSAGAVGWQSGGWWTDNWPVIVGAIFLVILVAVVIGSAGGKDKNAPPAEFRGIWTKD